jgi:hypothetical protein
MISPGFSAFRAILDQWDEHCALEQDVNQTLDDHGMILFFQKGDDLFGGPEESRIIFAKLKDPNEDDNFRDEAKFLATNLKSAIGGDKIENMFGFKDLDDIKLIDRDSVVDLLMNKKKEKK